MLKGTNIIGSTHDSKYKSINFSKKLAIFKHVFFCVRHVGIGYCALSSWCLVMWLFLKMLWVGLQYVIVVLPDHNHFFLTGC